MTRHRRSGFFTLLAIGALSGALFFGATSNLSAGRDVTWERGKSSATDKTLSPYFYIENGDPDIDSLPLENTRVRANITGVIADVKVRQRYKNTGKRPINLTYIFPASTRAAVHGMTMTIGEHVVRAKIKEKEEAKKIYEEAKKAGKSASLLEQKRPNVFKMSVANVMPGDVIDIELHYSELLVPTKGIYEFMYPTVVGPRFTGELPKAAHGENRWLKSPYLKEGKKPTSTLEITATVAAGLPLHSLNSPSHKVVAKWHDKTRATVELSAEESDGGNRDFVLHYRLTGGRIQSGLMLYEGKDENFFLLMVQPPKRVDPKMIPPRDYVFIVDVSGSMHGFPLDTAKVLVQHLIGGLRPTDTFNILFFSGGSAVLSPESLPATRSNINMALHMLSGQRGGGGTYMLAAIKRAMAMPTREGVSRNFVVITDGYVAAETQTFEYIRAHLNNANVYSFGIGSSVNRYLIEGVAKAGLGQPFVVLEAAHARREALSLKHYIESPVLTDIKIDYNGFAVYDVEPKSIPDVLADRPIIIHGKYKGKPKGTIIVRGATGAGDFRRAVQVSRKLVAEKNSALRFLWARTRVADLVDFNFGTWTKKNREAVVALGLKYTLLTKFTSFVAVYEVVRNLEGGAVDVKQPLPLPKGVSKYAVGGVRQGAEPALWLLVLGLGMLFWVRRREVLAA